MIIKVTGSKIRTDRGGGNEIEVLDLVNKLNLIVDKERSSWPDNRTEEEKAENKEIPKELKEGDTFLFHETVFGVGKNKLIQIISETGWGAINRIYEEYILPELEMFFGYDDSYEFGWDDNLSELPQNLTEMTPPYNMMKIWNENFESGRNLREKYIIRVKVIDPEIGLERPVYLTKWKLWYSEEDWMSEEIKLMFPIIMGWFYRDVDRLPETK